jgi:radical SAM protein with 4Fe4S-binding SPASM domain
MVNISKLYCGLAGQSDHLRYDITDSIGPVVVFNCTSRCNLRCLHCYSASDSSQRDDELTTAQAKKLLSDLLEASCPVVLFSGGEPLLRPDLFELLAEAKRIGLRTVLSTNGTLIDADTARKLADAEVSYIGISIDGPEKFHNRFRQTSGCFKAAMAGYDNCRNAGLRLGLRFTINGANKRQVPAVFDICKKNGIRRLCFYHLIRSGRASQIESQILTQPQTRRVVDTIIQKTDDYVGQKLLDEVLTVGNHADGPYLLVKMQNQNSKNFDEAKRLLLANGGNRIGEAIGCVNWTGNVFADQFWRNYSLGNVLEKSFKQIWTNKDEPVLMKLHNKSKFADKRCLKCKWFDLCRGNFRFLGTDPADKNWLLEPDCYLTDEEIGI